MYGAKVELQQLSVFHVLDMKSVTENLELASSLSSSPSCGL